MQKVQLILIAVFISFNGLSQKTSETIYYAWIKKLDRSITEKGYLIDLKKDQVTFIPKFRYSHIETGAQYQNIAYPVTDIGYIQIRKSNKVGNGILKGALWGGGTTGLLGILLNNTGCSGSSNCIQFDNSFVFLVSFMVGTIPGAIIGGAVGAKRHKFYINGNKTSYQKQREELRRFLLN